MKRSNTLAETVEFAPKSFGIVLGTLAIVFSLGAAVWCSILALGLSDSLSRYDSSMSVLGEASQASFDAIAYAGAIGRLDLISALLALIAVSALIIALPFAYYVKMIAEIEAKKVAIEVARQQTNIFLSEHIAENESDIFGPIIEKHLPQTMKSAVDSMLTREGIPQPDLTEVDANQNEDSIPTDTYWD